VAIILLITALLLVPLIYRKYVNGPPPPLTRGQYLKRAAFFGVFGCLYMTGVFMDHDTGWNLFWQCVTLVIWWMDGAKYLWLAYKRKEEYPSITQ